MLAPVSIRGVQEIPDRWRDLGTFIREQRDVSRLSLRRLSDLAGISNPYLSQIERGLRKPSAEILQQIARALRISAETLYERAGLLEAHENGGDTVAAILRDLSLTEDARQTLIKVYASLRTEPPPASVLAPGGAGPAASGPAASGPEADRPGAGSTAGTAAHDGMAADARATAPETSV